MNESVQMFTLQTIMLCHQVIICLLPSVVVAAIGPDGRCVCSTAGITVISVHVYTMYKEDEESYRWLHVLGMQSLLAVQLSLHTVVTN